MKDLNPIIDPKRTRQLNIGAWVISAIVLIVVVAMRRIHFDTNIDFSWLPGFYSGINLVTAVLLVMAVRAIKRKDAATHKKWMLMAMSLSAVFIISYVTYHTTTTETAYCGEGAIRYVYFFLLITHVVLAGIIFPFILFTFVRAITGRYELHKKMARYVFPLWLYIAVTGPIIYAFLFPCYS